jgi:hypothetical protein
VAYYFDYTTFNELALAPETTLIIGRRGSGKTSLANYFTFQKNIPNAISIDVSEPEIYEQVLTIMAGKAASTSEIAIPLMAKVWEYVIWSLIFKEYREHDADIRKAFLVYNPSSSAPHLVLQVLRGLVERYLKDDGIIVDELEDFLKSRAYNSAKAAVLRLSQRMPVIVAIDSLEHYDTNNEAVMRATAALIQCATQFTSQYARKGVHLKVFITGEIFPYLVENVVTNPLKYVRNPVFLLWSPKDLLRLVCWRFYHYLARDGMLLPESGGTIDWGSGSDVLTKMWTPYFGETVESEGGLIENTYPYILRHTQMRPRQLILLCNRIADLAKKEGTFPRISQRSLVNAIRTGERELATEVINSYSRIYPGVGWILDALVGGPMIFPGRDLDRIAPRTASVWQFGDYSPLKFRQVVAELGVVGRVRRRDERTGIIEADFEYAMHDRLPLQVDDDCVIHPMFYQRLNAQITNRVIVYPFPDHPEYDTLRAKRPWI